ncbi:NAD-dependent epimerase/dehydratase family protein [Spirochaeta cellobiosiphila]|uniref:NAD-dependent epimerase/dehydratase family protein n=1 Tax=Spirochaeta cellobiosiphila TaxID=504483 RepID=UPI000421F676|nr:NAD(P)-dependent oxidoreductase [Spirochaeta cellobiosiphila]
MEAIVFGASGFIGSHVAQQLKEVGYHVTGIIRKSSDSHFLETLGITIERLDFSSDDQLFQSMRKKALVYNCIAAVTATDEAILRETEIELPRRIIRAAAKGGVAGYIQLSSIIAYGPHMPDSPLNENFTPRPKDLLDRISWERELAVKEECHKRNVPFVILEPVTTIGSRDKHSALHQLFLGHKKGEFPLVKDGESRMSGIDTRDIGRAMAWIGDNMDILKGETLITKGYDFQWKELKSLLDEFWGIKAKEGKLNFHLLYPLSFLLEKIMKNPPVTRALLLALGKNKIYDDTKIRNLGFKTIYTVQDSLKYALNTIN